MSTQRTISGAAVKVYIGGKLFPEIQSISFNEDRSETAIYGIDSLFPQEITPTKVTVSGNISGIKIRNSGMSEVGGLSKLSEILKMPYISISINDISTGKIIWFFPQAKISSQSYSVSAKQIITAQFSFKAIYFVNSTDLY